MIPAGIGMTNSDMEGENVVSDGFDIAGEHIRLAGECTRQRQHQ
jgi:hypothetical protein